MLDQIVDLEALIEEQRIDVAMLLVEGFREFAPNAWPDLDAALEEVRESLAEDRISRVALAKEGKVLGWIGGIRQYGGNVWELHPLVVHTQFQRMGIGSALIRDLEQQVRERGGRVIWLGTDDEDNRTSLAGVDLFPNPLEHLMGIRNLRDHPFTFYEKMGFIVTGVMPDANGYGKPDIFMAKRV